MRITDVQAFLLSSPMPEPIVMEYYGGLRTIFKRDAALVRIQTFVAVPESDHLPNPVGMAKLEHHRPNHAVQARAEPAAGHDTDRGPARLEEDVLAGAGLLELKTGVGLPASVRLHMHQHPSLVQDEVSDVVVRDGGQLERGDHRALAQVLDRQLCFGQHGHPSWT